MLEVIGALILIALIGNVLLCLSLRQKTSGTLIIDRSDPDGPYVFLELSTDIVDVSKRKKVVLEINNVNYLPHK